MTLSNWKMPVTYSSKIAIFQQMAMPKCLKLEGVAAWLIIPTVNHLMATSLAVC